MRTPWLIQRCEFAGGKLCYDYMGSAEFEVGGQPKSLKRIFEKGITPGAAEIETSGKKIPVYMVAGAGFPFAEYQPYLQELAENKIRLQEASYFDTLADRQAGLNVCRNWIPPTRVWFDFENDVLWTLSETDQKKLVSILEGIKQKWAEK